MPRRTRLPALGSRLWAFGPGALSGVSLPLLPVLPVLLVKCGRKVVHGEPGTDVRTASNDRRAPGGWTGQEFIGPRKAKRPSKGSAGPSCSVGPCRSSVIASGDVPSTPLVLFHGSGTNATSWIRDIAEWVPALPRLHGRCDRGARAQRPVAASTHLRSLMLRSVQPRLNAKLVRRLAEHRVEPANELKRRYGGCSRNLPNRQWLDGRLAQHVSGAAQTNEFDSGEHLLWYVVVSGLVKWWLARLEKRLLSPGTRGESPAGVSARP